MSLVEDVYGVSYKSALEEMSLLRQSISQQVNIGFESLEDLRLWAHQHLLDKVAYVQMGKQFMCVSHKGELLTYTAFSTYYANILFYKKEQGDRIRKIVWSPEGFEYLDDAYVISEQGDGIHKPLYSRNYVLPTGYYDAVSDTFNVAKPFPVFAAPTGRDTSHIYRYIEHVAGECAMHLLAWLRAKMLYPTSKTQVVPIIVSRAQGSGKTTFAEVICKGLFGKENVLVTDQYDSQARFNADYADALIVCQEEKEETDRRNPAAAIKSRATATTIRKEQKGVDPIYQESYTDFIMTTNKDVPIKFDGREDQRRFMIMEADESFTRKTSDLADEVFSKLYGYDANFNKVGVPFVDDKPLIAQFKHELFVRPDVQAVQLRNFPKTDAYRKCFSLPRTNENIDIESIVRSLIPFFKCYLEEKKKVNVVDDIKLTDIVPTDYAVQYIPEFNGVPGMVCLCRPLVFIDTNTNKPYAHSTVERALLECNAWLKNEGLMFMADMTPFPGGFPGVTGKYRSAPCARVTTSGTEKPKLMKIADFDADKLPEAPLQLQAPRDAPSRRNGSRLSYNNKWKQDPNGEFETVNEIKSGCERSSATVEYLDTFLLESDSTSPSIITMEKNRAQAVTSILAEELFKERLHLQSEVGQQLFDDGIVARIVYSGAKSYHLLVRVADSPKTLDEYKWLHGYLCKTVTQKLEFDESTADPSRLTRAPVTRQRITRHYDIAVTGTQCLICEDWSHVYDINWRKSYQLWLDRPLEEIERKYGKKLIPTRPEYKGACIALINGSFWDSDEWDGIRQKCFFPGYRLLRYLGYDHDGAWEVINKHVDRYKKKAEIGYWKSRETSELIQNIDRDIEEGF